jgi:2-polyprenyl-3-methyl-5-hydroxy-6-metoxy-1,4-benzoquinol methylase
LHNIEFEETSAQSYASSGKRAASFDYVLLLDVTEHIDDDILSDVLLAAKRLLKSDGKLIIHTPNLSYWLELLKDRGIIAQLNGHIAVRNERHYRDLIEQAEFVAPQVRGLPHYRQPLRLVDRLLMWIPILGRLFRSRLFIVVPNSANNRVEAVD